MDHLSCLHLISVTLVVFGHLDIVYFWSIDDSRVHKKVVIILCDLSFTRGHAKFLTGIVPRLFFIFIFYCK